MVADFRHLGSNSRCDTQCHKSNPGGKSLTEEGVVAICVKGINGCPGVAF